MAKRGRPKASEEASRREAVIQAAFEVLVEKGYENTTMFSIAKRAGSSKETLYAWFGNKEGLYSTLIRRQADTTVERVNTALEGGTNPRATLINFAIGLLRLLLGEPSISLNRGAMSSPELASLLLEQGRFMAGAAVERYLERLVKQGDLKITDSGTAFQLLYGLIVQDWQIRVLLGDTPPSHDDVVQHAEKAIDYFLSLCSTEKEI